MAESTVRVATDSDGKRVRTRQRLVSAVSVEEQYVAMAGEPTYYIWCTATACAQNKFFLALQNTSANQLVKLRKIFLSNAQVAAATGTVVQFDFTRCSSITGGATVVPNAMDTNDGSVSGLTCVAGPSIVTQGVTLYSWYTTNDEVGVTNAFPTSIIQAGINTVPEGNEIKELVLRQNQGVCIKQITNSAVGQYAVLAVITIE